VPPILGGTHFFLMIELRLTADVKRIAAMRDAIRRECARVETSVEHAEMVAFVAEPLVGGFGPSRKRTGRRLSEVLMIVTVQSDATMLMVRDPRPTHAELGESRQRMLQQHTTRWSTMSGRDGRTVWAEIARPAGPTPEPVAVAPVPVVATPSERNAVAEPADPAAWSDRAIRLRLRVAPALPASD
jgi:hypothetical protein